MIQLRWKASFSASCLHAAACMFEGLPIADSSIARKLQPKADALVAQLEACGFVAEKTLPELVSLAADYENNRQLIEMAATRIHGSGSLSTSAIALLAGCVSDLEAAWLTEHPELVEQLAVRGRPIREQWEARGPGLLRAIEKLTNDKFIASSAEIVLVSPVVGGHGRAHLRNNRVTFEAILTNPNPELPETLRLAWLLAQLNLDMPMFGEVVPRGRLPQLASLATIPLVFAAADAVDLATLDQPTLEQALRTWHLEPLVADDAPQRLLDWWLAYANGDSRWSIAMAALDQMF